MYSLAVSDHVMIAHSFVGEIFGPAQRLHGATYAVEVEFRRAELDGDGLICDIGKALETLKAVLDEINYRNLDEVPGFKGRNTTTEFLAGDIFRRLKTRIAAGALGPGIAGALASMRVTLRESPVAWAAFEGKLSEGPHG
jgi:6-pyruvoyl-tetrahydropterin synthase